MHEASREVAAREVAPSDKVADGDSWRHTKITLKPVNPDFQPIVLTSADEGELQVVAELAEVLQ